MSSLTLPQGPGASLRDSFRASFRALRHRDFRLYWSGQVISLAGTWMQAVAQGWLMHRLTGSPFMLGLLGFAQFIPVTVLSLPAGVVADRMTRRRLVLITQTALMLQAGLLASVVGAGIVRPWMVVALASVFGAINAFDLPARQSFVIEMVGKEDLSNAIALNAAAFNGARVFGPAVAGVVLAAAGEAACFWVNAVSYLAVIAVLARMDLGRAPESADTDRPTLRDGIRYVMQTRSIRNLLLLLGITTSLGFQYTVLLPVYAREILHAGPEAMGLMVSAFGVGSLLAVARMTRDLRRWDLRRNLLVGLCAAAFGMGGFAWSRSLPLTLAMGFLAGFGLILYVASTNTLVQITTEDRFRGRVMSLYTLMFVGTAPLGTLAAGWIAQRLGAPAATTFSAAVLFAGAVWVFVRLRVLAAREAARPTVPAMTDKLG